MAAERMESLTIPDILAMREEGRLFAELEEKRYVLILYELYPNGTSSNDLIEDNAIAKQIGKVTGLGDPTDPCGWGIWTIDPKKGVDRSAG